MNFGRWNASEYACKSHIAWQNAHHRPAQASRNGLQRTDNIVNLEVYEADKQAMGRAWAVLPGTG